MARKNTRHVRAATPAAPSPALPASAPPRGAGAPVGAPRRTAQSGAVRPGHCRAGGGREGPSGGAVWGRPRDRRMGKAGGNLVLQLSQRRIFRLRL
jgi:hypothetical protein